VDNFVGQGNAFRGMENQNPGRDTLPLGVDNKGSYQMPCSQKMPNRARDHLGSAQQNRQTLSTTQPRAQPTQVHPRQGMTTRGRKVSSEPRSMCEKAPTEARLAKQSMETIEGDYSLLGSHSHLRLELLRLPLLIHYPHW